MAVTSIPQHFRIAPNELATTPFPIPLITPPVTKMYFLLDIATSGVIPVFSYKNRLELAFGRDSLVFRLNIQVTRATRH